MQTPTPVFVYGTLRTGQGNWQWALQDRTTSAHLATVTGFQMYGLQGYPYAVHTDNDKHLIHGEVMHIDPEQYDEVMADLDRLEGYRPDNKNSHYDKKIIQATLEDGTKVEAYIYFVYDIPARNLPLTLNQDWVNRFSGWAGIIVPDTEEAISATNHIAEHIPLETDITEKVDLMIGVSPSETHPDFWEPNTSPTRTPKLGRLVRFEGSADQFEHMVTGYRSRHETFYIPFSVGEENFLLRIR